MKFTLKEPKFYILTEKYILNEAEENKDAEQPNTIAKIASNVDYIKKVVNNLNALLNTADNLQILNTIDYHSSDIEAFSSTIVNQPWNTLINFIDKLSRSKTGELKMLTSLKTAINNIIGSDQEANNFLNDFISNSTDGEQKNSVDFLKIIRQSTENFNKLKGLYNDIKRVSNGSNAAQTINKKFESDIRNAVAACIEDTKSTKNIAEKLTKLGNVFANVSKLDPIENGENGLIANSKKIESAMDAVNAFNSKDDTGKSINAASEETVNQYNKLVENTNKKVEEIDNLLKDLTEKVKAASVSDKMNKTTTLDNIVQKLVNSASELNDSLINENNALNKLAQELQAISTRKAEVDKDETLKVEWDSELSKAASSGNSLVYSSMLKKYWNAYWTENELNVLKSIEVTLQEELKLGYTVISNPFIAYLKNILKDTTLASNLKANPDAYDAVHDAAVRNHQINTSTLRSANSANIIFNEDFFTKSYEECRQYLRWQDIIATLLSNANSSSVSSSEGSYYNQDIKDLLIKKYTNKAVPEYTISNFAIDTLYETGNPLSASENRTTNISAEDSHKLKLRKLEDINKILTACFSKTAMENAVAKENNKIKIELNKSNIKKVAGEITKKVTADQVGETDRYNYGIKILAALLKVFNSKNSNITLNMLTSDEKFNKISDISKHGDIKKDIENAYIIQNDSSAEEIVAKALPEVNITNAANEPGTAVSFMLETLKNIINLEQIDNNKKKETEK